MYGCGTWGCYGFRSGLFLMDRKIKLMEDAYSDKFEAELAETKALYKEAISKEVTRYETQQEMQDAYAERSSVYNPSIKPDTNTTQEVNYNTMFKSKPTEVDLTTEVQLLRIERKLYIMLMTSVLKHSYTRMKRNPIIFLSRSSGKNPDMIR